jgi:hypothetical protein
MRAILEHWVYGWSGQGSRPKYMPRRQLNLPQFDGHFKKGTIEMKGVSNER